MTRQPTASDDYYTVKVQHLDLSFSGVEVELLEIGNTQVKYKCLKNEFQYSTQVNVLSFFKLLNRDHGNGTRTRIALSG